MVGGRLAQHGQDVVLIARVAHREAIDADGLLLRTPDDEVRVPVPVVGHPGELDLGPGDVVLPRPEQALTRTRNPGSLSISRDGVAISDFIDEMVAERTRLNPEFPRLLRAAVRRRGLASELEVGGDADSAQDPK